MLPLVSCSTTRRGGRGMGGARVDASCMCVLYIVPPRLWGRRWICVPLARSVTIPPPARILVSKMSESQPQTGITPPPKAAAPKGRLMSHVDRQDLYTSLEARIRYLHSFLDFNSSLCQPCVTSRKPSLGDPSLTSNLAKQTTSTP